MVIKFLKIIIDFFMYLAHLENYRYSKTYKPYFK